MATSNHLFLIMFLIIPLVPVEITAATNEINYRHCSSEIIFVKISNPSDRFTDSNPPDCDNSSNIFSIDVFESISISLTGRPGTIIISSIDGKYKFVP